MPICRSCGEEKERLGQHFAMSDCGYPDIDREIVDGLLLGDGDIPHKNKNAYLRVRNTNKEWLNQLSSTIPESYGPALSRTAEEVAKMNEDSGFSKNVELSRYNDVYRWQTASNEKLNKHRERWWKTGEKRVPDDLELTPIVVRHWMAGDGNLNWSGDCFASVRFGRMDERDDEKLISLFEDVGIESVKRNGNHISVYSQDARDLLDWSTPEPDGMEYKWSYESKEEYKKLK
jgi:hypothetical protein